MPELVPVLWGRRVKIGPHKASDEGLREPGAESKVGAWSVGAPKEGGGVVGGGGELGEGGEFGEVAGGEGVGMM